MDGRMDRQTDRQNLDVWLVDSFDIVSWERICKYGYFLWTPNPRIVFNFLVDYNWEHLFHPLKFCFHWNTCLIFYYYFIT